MAMVETYFPEAGDRWERREPAAVGMNAEGLAEAAAFADANETSWPRDLGEAIRRNVSANEGEYGAIVGPVRERGGVNGIVLRHGFIVHEWGKPTGSI